MTPHAMAGASNSNGFVSFHDLAFQFTGLCDAGIQVADAARISVETPINVHAVMASEAKFQGNDPRGISHLDFEAIYAAFLDAIVACSWTTESGALRRAYVAFACGGTGSGAKSSGASCTRIASQLATVRVRRIARIICLAWVRRGSPPN